MPQDKALTVPGTIAARSAVRPASHRPIQTGPVLSGRAKAAIIVRMLLNEGADLPLEDLPEDLQESLAHQMGRMGLVDRDTLYDVAQEFAERLDGVGLSFPSGIGGAISSLDGQISPQTAARLRREAGVRMAGDPWDRLRALPSEELIPIMQAEGTEIAAVVLSKLDVQQAATLLSHLPGPDARRIALAVSQTGAITPETVDRIGLSLATQLDDRPLSAFSSAPGERVGAILNLSPATMRDEMLGALEDVDESFALDVRRSIFVFAHIKDRVTPRDVPQIIRDVDQEELLRALAFSAAGEDRDSANFLLANISARMAESLREEMAELAPIGQKVGEAAQNTVIATIRQLETAGILNLIVPEGSDPE